MVILEGRGVKGYQGLKRCKLDHLEVMRDRQVHAYELVREEGASSKESPYTIETLDLSKQDNVHRSEDKLTLSLKRK